MCPACVIPWFVVALGLTGTTFGMWLAEHSWVFYTAIAFNLVLIAWGGLKLKKYYGKHKGCDIE